VVHLVLLVLGEVQASLVLQAKAVPTVGIRIRTSYTQLRGTLTDVDSFWRTAFRKS